MSNNTGCSCCGDIVDLTMTTEDMNKCPICNQEGKKVKNITVKHLVKEEYVESVETMNYSICMNEDCDTVYFSENKGIQFSKKQVKVPIWFKKDADPRYACYCSEVTITRIMNPPYMLIHCILKIYQIKRALSIIWILIINKFNESPVVYLSV